ncbi:lycopene cyclase domain-containing protein [Demequina lutea]|uniref:Lycopene cyclase domain-containing protein n=1 Tax=Demequina lutea TaxID=431489 RepID=A0A7Y9Z711_9MICO|nr:lycopene cyclase domain-containing protein [Demequina lutea]NYI39982.1 lycopene cyclase domain-containing protein [Demequina lutea]
MTYALLSLAVLATLALVSVPTLRRLPFRPLALTALALVALTAVFDNVIVGLDIVAYDAAKISGLLVPVAPVEDFAYAIGAILLVPTVWTLLGRRKPGGGAQ